MKFYEKMILFLFGSELDRRREAFVAQLLEELKAERTRQADKLMVERVERWEKLYQLRDERLQQLGLEREMRAAISAFKNKDLERFESLIDVEAFGLRAAEALTQDLALGSDYMGIASNCGMLNLLESPPPGNWHDLLMKPVQDTYRAALRELVSSHRLLNEDLHMPEIELYRQEDDSGFPEEIGLSSKLAHYFAPKVYFDLFGRSLRLPDPLTFTHNAAWAEFPILLENDALNFSGELVVRVCRSSTGKLDLSFPYFIELLANAQDATDHIIRFIDELRLGVRAFRPIGEKPAGAP